MLRTIKSITIFHLIGLLIGNVGFEYFITGALGFNLLGFMLAIVLLVGILYLIDKFLKTDLQKRVEKLDVWMQPEDGSLSDVEKDMLKKYRETEKKVTENIHHEIEHPTKLLDEQLEKITENFINTKKEKVYI